MQLSRSVRIAPQYLTLILNAFVLVAVDGDDDGDDAVRLAPSPNPPGLHSYTRKVKTESNHRSLPLSEDLFNKLLRVREDSEV